MPQRWELQLEERQKLQAMIKDGYSLEETNRAKRRDWVTNHFYGRSPTSQLEDKYGSGNFQTTKLAAE